MNMTSTSWMCGTCGGAYTGTPPEDGQCDDCIAKPPCTCPPPAVTATCPDALNTCAECGGPVCPGCGQRLLLLIPVSTPAGGDTP